MRPWAQDEYLVLDAAGRSWLQQLAARPLAWSTSRRVPSDVLPLIHQGLAFRSAFQVTITAKGEDLLDRVA